MRSGRSPSRRTARITRISAGWRPGSMALATEIYQEGFRLPPVKIDGGGRAGARRLRTVPRQHARARGARGRPARADRRRCGVGAERLRGLVATSGARQVAAAMEALKDYADR